MIMAKHVINEHVECGVLERVKQQLGVKNPTSVS